MPKFTDTLSLSIDDTQPSAPREASDDDITAPRTIDAVAYDRPHAAVAPVKQAPARYQVVPTVPTMWRLMGPWGAAYAAAVVAGALPLVVDLSHWTTLTVAALCAFAGWVTWHVVHDRVSPPAQPVTTPADDTLAWCERRVLSAALAYDQAETEWWASQVDMLARNRARDELQHACARLRVEMGRVRS